MNAQEGASLLRTAESALGEISSILGRVRVLAIQASNGTLTAEDRVEIQREVDQLLDEVDRTATATEYNTKSLLSGELAGLTSTDTDALKAILTGDATTDRNYRIEAQTTPGDVQVLKSDIFRIVAGDQYRLGVRGLADSLTALEETVVYRRRASSEIVLRDATGAERVIDSNALSDTDMLAPTLSADGSQLAYLRYDSGGVLQVWTYDLEALGSGQGSGVPRQVTASATDVLSVDWSVSGGRLLYETAGAVWTIASDARQTLGVRVSDVTEAVAAGTAQWSPVDDRILYQTAGGLVVRGPGGSTAERFGDAASANASWSPDGSRVLYDNGNDAQTDGANLFVFDLATGTTTQITSESAGASAQRAAWSPSGTRIAFVRDVDARTGADFVDYRVVTIALDGQGAVELDAGRKYAFEEAQDDLQWTRDGEWIYFTEHEGRAHEHNPPLPPLPTSGCGTSTVHRARSDGSTSQDELTDSITGEETQLEVGVSAVRLAASEAPRSGDFSLWQDMDWSAAPSRGSTAGSANLFADFRIQYAAASSSDMGVIAESGVAATSVGVATAVPNVPIAVGVTPLTYVQPIAVAAAANPIATPANVSAAVGSLVAGAAANDQAYINVTLVDPTLPGTLPAGNYTYTIVARDGLNQEINRSTAINTSIPGGPNSIQLNWAAEAGAASYRVYVTDDTGRADRYWDTAATTFTDDNQAPSGLGSVPADPQLTAGNYAYTVVAYDALGHTITSAETAPVAIANHGSVTVNWGAVTGAVSYRVYGRAPGTPTMYWSTAGLSITDTGSNGTVGAPPAQSTLGAGTYHYQIIAYNAFNQQVGRTTADATVALGAPGQTTLDWDAVAGATYYRVYGRGAGAGGKTMYWQTTATALIDDGTAGAAAAGMPNGPGLAPGTYQYRVIAYDASGHEIGRVRSTDATASATGTTSQGYWTTAATSFTDSGQAYGTAVVAYPAAPPLSAGNYTYHVLAFDSVGRELNRSTVTGVNAALASDGRIRLNWGAQAGAAYYRVYGRAPGAASADRYWQTAGTTFTDWGTGGIAGGLPLPPTLAAGTYDYTVIGYDESGREVGRSGEFGDTLPEVGHMNLTWDRMTHAAYYEVWGRASGAPDRYWRVDTESFADYGNATPGTPGAMPVAPGTLGAGNYAYQVIAYNALDIEVSRTSVIETSLGVNGQVTLIWDDVKGAAYYRVYGRDVLGADTYWTTTGATWTDHGEAGTAGATPDEPDPVQTDRFGLADYRTADRWSGFLLSRNESAGAPAALGDDAYTRAAPYVLLQVVGVSATTAEALTTLQGDRMVIDTSYRDENRAAQRLEMRATTYSREGEAVSESTFTLDADDWSSSMDILGAVSGLEGAYTGTLVRMGATGDSVAAGDSVLLLYDNGAQYGDRGAVWTSRNANDTGGYDLDTTGGSLRTGAATNQAGARVVAGSTIEAMADSVVRQSLAWLDDEGAIHVGAGQYAFGSQPSTSVTFDLLETDLAEAETELKWIDRFQVASSIFDQQAQTLTVYSNGERSDIVLQAGDTLGGVAEKLRRAVTRDVDEGGLGLGTNGGRSVRDVDRNVAVFVEEAVANTDEAVAGTLVLRSTLPGLDGRFFFAGSERLVNAFSWMEVRDATANSIDVAVYDAHSGEAAGHARTDDGVLRSVIDGVDLRLSALLDLRVAWNEDSRSFETYSGYGLATQHVHVADNALTLHIGANENQTMAAVIGDMTREGLELGDLLVVEREAAEEAIVLVDRAGAKVTSQRARIGAYINRLSSTTAILDIAAENMVSAESGIRDLDIAHETLRFTAQQILVQTSTAMLAQANSLGQSVLSLLS